MPHIWESFDATFKDVSNLLESLTVGDISTTEKFDGVNICFRVDKNGTVRFSRSLGDRNEGGFTFQDALTKYQNHPAGEVFIEGCRAIDEAYTDTWWPFGYSGRDWINSEIVYPEKEQLLKYDKNAIVFHNPVTFLPDGRKFVDPAKSQKIDRILTVESVETITTREWHFFGPQQVSLPNDSGLGYLTDAVDRLNACMVATNLNEESTLREFLRVSLRNGPVNEIKTSEFIKDKLADKISGIDDTVRLIDLKKGQPPAIAAQISFLGQKKNELKHRTAAMKPIINTLNVFSAKRLNSLNSALISDKKGCQQRISELINLEAEFVQSHDDGFREQRKEMFNELLEQWQMSKTEPPSIEGLTFDFQGSRTKITGGFASLNQLLGLRRYGRGNIPAVKQDKKMSANNLLEYFGLV